MCRATRSISWLFVAAGRSGSELPAPSRRRRLSTGAVGCRVAKGASFGGGGSCGRGGGAGGEGAASCGVLSGNAIMAERRFASGLEQALEFCPTRDAWNLSNKVRYDQLRHAFLERRITDGQQLTFEETSVQNRL